MFDFGFSELIVIGVVLLVVVGPERLPRVARTAGHLLGRVQRYVSDVKSDIQREMQLDELKKLQEQVRQQAQELESSVRSGAAGAEAEAERTVGELRSMLPAPDSGQPAAGPQPDPSAAGPQPDPSAAGASPPVAASAATVSASTNPLPQDPPPQAAGESQLELGLGAAARPPAPLGDKTKA
ncbi:Sec-independent protein translocase protein TatB [Thauera chlorobenzoica]|uniref:Sec-independent protein translocase protein TatB n=1 Tax=Thauera chlorobenzoica TaxID=96773 RepID=A0A1H5URV3_9RHOO|nr:Sec-independent protein translocase protein TatB [Thauera chlorobenzoica]APR03506.1 Twin-arginine translocation protein TatB [Thauera chlorobenzoica]SEF76947.1 sec-independent protein translocase protein TatB [Thauera chlorobenzoica]